MYLEHFQFSQSPFRQEPDPKIFYPGAGRRSVLESIQSDIQEGKPLIKLTGGEGVGKTLLYLLLIRKLSPEAYDIVSLDHPVGSFEDLLRIICVALGYEATLDESAPRRYVDVFREQLQLRKNEQRKVLLIIDEAEKLFLATLERLVKTICDTEEADVLQILLVGRLDLDVSIEQLTIYCSNVDVHAGYVLEPMNLDETGRYMQFRLQCAEIMGGKHLALFTDDAVHAIYQSAKGNISLTNTIAEGGLKTACSEGAFQVEPEFIGFQPAGKKGSLQAVSKVSQIMLPWYDQLKASRFYDLLMEHKWWSTAIVLLFILLLIVVRSGDEDNVQDPATLDKVALEQVVIEEREVVVPPVQEKQLYVEEKPVQPEKPEKTEEQVENKKTEQIVVYADAKKQKGEIFSAKEKPRTEAPARDGSALFRERMKTSSNWMAWSYRGGYTIQLMRLTSDNAEANLKKILVEDEYFAVMDKLHILRRESPPALFVFYGMYASMDEARQARNGMSILLRKHHPYALSIKEALKKTQE